MKQFLWWVLRISALAALFHLLSTCLCAFLTQRVQLLPETPLGTLEVCLAAAIAVDLITDAFTNHFADVAATIAVAWLLLWRSLTGAAFAWLVVPDPVMAAPAAIGAALGGFIATVWKWARQT